MWSSSKGEAQVEKPQRLRHPFSSASPHQAFGSLVEVDHPLHHLSSLPPPLGTKCHRLVGRCDAISGELGRSLRWGGQL